MRAARSIYRKGKRERVKRERGGERESERVREWEDGRG
jgi:hypothetical protein